VAHTIFVKIQRLTVDGTGTYQRQNDAPAYLMGTKNCLSPRDRQIDRWNKSSASAEITDRMVKQSRQFRKSNIINIRNINSAFATVGAGAASFFVSKKVGRLRKQNRTRSSAFAQTVQHDTAMSVEIFTSAAQLYAKIAFEKT